MKTFMSFSTGLLLGALGFAAILLSLEKGPNMIRNMQKTLGWY